jgi:hypothetical protein
MRRITPRAASVVALALALAATGQGAILARADVPFATTRAEISVDEGRIVAAHRSIPDPNDGSWGMRRREARERAKRKACGMVHCALDDRLARSAATPPEIAALQRAVEAHCVVVGVRPVVVGGAVVSALGFGVAALLAALTLGA